MKSDAGGDVLLGVKLKELTPERSCYIDKYMKMNRIKVLYHLRLLDFKLI